MSVIDEPAVAVAVALCLTARAIADARTARHPRRCGWCDYPTTELTRMVAGWNAWAGFDERHGTYERHEARVFQAMPRDQQIAAITAAQSFEPDAPPEPMAPPVVPTPVDEEVLPWL